MMIVWWNENCNKWLNLAKKQTHRFFDVVATNSNIDLSECHFKLIIEFDIIQREIDSAYHNSIQQRETSFASANIVQHAFNLMKN
jgi:hypothetical protein